MKKKTAGIIAGVIGTALAIGGAIFMGSKKCNSNETDETTCEFEVVEPAEETE